VASSDFKSYGRNWRFPGLFTILAITIETRKSLNESDRFRALHLTHAGGMVGRSGAAFCGAHSVNQGTAAAFPRHWFSTLARSLLYVLATGGERRSRSGDGMNLWACQKGQWDEVLSALRGVMT